MTLLARLRVTGRNDQQRERWERAVDPLLLFLALAMLPLFLVPLLAEVSAQVERWCIVGGLAIWVVFTVDIVVRTWFAERRILFLKTHWLEVLIVLLPVLRPLRAIKLLLVLMALHRMLRRRAVGGALLIAVLGILGATLVTWAAEQAADGTIDNLGTALWWALATITTVGYGDVAPITTVGRIAGAILMVIGIGVFGVLTANVAAWFVERGQDKEKLEILNQLDRLEAELKALRQVLVERDASPR